MSNWDTICKTARMTGNFAGKTPREQDDYFAFFGKERPRFFHKFTRDARDR